MHQLPNMTELCEQLEEVLAEHVTFDRPLNPRAALMRDLGFDSLDMIETSFCIQEYFEFEFSDRNPIEALNLALGGDLLVFETKLTELGRQIARERMPELGELPDDLSANTLQSYFTLETFARLILEFLEATPESDPASGEAVTIQACRPRTISGAIPSNLPKGEALLDAWVNSAVTRYQTP